MGLRYHFCKKSGHVSKSDAANCERTFTREGEKKMRKENTEDGE